MMRRVMAVMGVAAVALAMASSAAAQVPGFNLNLFPRVGVFQPRSNVTETGAVVKLRGGLAIGLSAELALPLLPDIRANLDYVPKVGTTVNDVDENSDNTLLALTADLVMSLSPPLSPIKPYLLLGGGVKRYEFDPRLDGTDSKESDLTLHAGAGIGFKFGPLSLVGEASDYISWFKPEGASSGKMQNDIFIMAGFKIGMF